MVMTGKSEQNIKMTKDECVKVLKDSKSLEITIKDKLHNVVFLNQADTEIYKVFEQLIKEHFDNSLFRNYDKMRKRVVAQSETIAELNDQLSRYVEWETNLPLTFEQLNDYMSYYDDVLKKDCIIAQVYSELDILIGYYDESDGIHEEWIKFEEGRFYAKRIV